jgi:hypothetical protein
MSITKSRFLLHLCCTDVRLPLGRWVLEVKSKMYCPYITNAAFIKLTILSSRAHDRRTTPPFGMVTDSLGYGPNFPCPLESTESGHAINSEISVESLA